MVKMDLTYVLCLYIVVVVVSIVIIYYMGVALGGSIILSLLIGQFLINILKPPSDVDPDCNQNNSGLAFYVVIQIATPIIAFFFILYYAINDKRQVY